MAKDEGEDVSPLLRINTARLVKMGEDSLEMLVPLDSNQLKTLKQAVRSNDAVIPHYVSYLFSSLERSSSERRHVLLSLFDYFFTRSHLFRLNTIERLQDLLRLVCEIDPLHHPLPPTKDGAKALKLFAIKTIKKWHEKFAIGYEKLQNVSQFLQMSKSLDFEQASAELQIDKRRKEAERKKAEEKAEKMASLIVSKFSVAKIDIDRCLVEVDSALNILVPVFAEEDGNEVDQGNEAASTSTAGLHGYSANQTITVVLKDAVPTIRVDSDNEDVVQAVRDARVMLDVHRNLLSKWLRKLTSSGCTQNVVKDLIVLKGRIDGYCSKIDELKLKSLALRKKPNGSDSEDDSDFEDVPEKEMEEFVPPDDVPKYIMDKLVQEDEQQPCCSRSLAETEGIETPDSPVLPLEPAGPSIPTLSFGLDLKYWGEGKRDAVQVPKNNADCHRFWRPPDDDGVASHDASVYETRVFTFIGEELRPRRDCRARLANGKLCPRRDAERCPIHGLVVDRDEEGFPVKEQDAAADQSIRIESAEKEEEEYMRDLEAATGRSFLPKKKSRRNILEGKVVRERLEKKLLDKRAVKRVSETLEAVRRAKIHKKFGNQFAHSLSR